MGVSTADVPVPITQRPSIPEPNMFRWLRRDPKHLIERRQSMLRALADYPAYAPPHRQSPNFLRRLPRQSEVEREILFLRFIERGHENFSFFLEHREARMT